MSKRNHLKTLEFHKILLSLSQLVQCEENEEKALSIKPYKDYETAKKEIEHTDQMVQFVLAKGAVGLDKITPVKETVLRAQKGGVLGLKEFLEIDKMCVNIGRLITWYYGEETKKEENNEVDFLFQSLTDVDFLHEEIRQVVINEEQISDRASGELFQIRRQIRQNQNAAREIVEKMVRSNNVQKYLQEAIVTMRDGRYVLPVKAEFKNMVPGLVHDMSSSGQTFFVEPMSAVEANNTLKVLESQELAEITKILTHLSERVGQCKDQLIYNYENLLDIDLYLGKAKLALDMGATKPIINNEKRIDLKKARHPLIDKKDVVPIDVNLGISFDTLIVTGPNTGGKTVTLKTLGLFSLMGLSGLFIPAQEKSEIAFFEKIWVDIGDEQSIEQSLSTFSSHMVNIISILKRADQNSLVLLDELGAGTDPVEGAALAISIIETLRKKGTMVCATTHYPELKTYAIDTKGVENASCSFDLKTLKPTYRLSIGIPGASNAFAISKRLGMSDRVITRAKEHIDEESKLLENTIAQMEAQKQQLQREQSELEKVKRELESSKRDNDKLNRRLKAQLESAEKQASLRINSLVQGVTDKANKLLQELEVAQKEAKKGANNQSLNSLRKGFYNKIDGLYDIIEPVGEKKSDYKLPRMPKVGEEVLLMDLDKKAVVQTLPDKNGNLEVVAGIIKTRTNINNIKLLDEKQRVTVNKKPVSRTTKQLSKKQTAIELDIRGEYPEDAILEIDRFIDNCVLGNIPSVTIIHGKGTGVLKKAVQAHLKKHKSVENYRFGSFGEGEDGVTIVQLR